MSSTDSVAEEPAAEESAFAVCSAVVGADVSEVDSAAGTSAGVEGCVSATSSLTVPPDAGSADDVDAAAWVGAGSDAGA